MKFAIFTRLAMSIDDRVKSIPFGGRLDVPILTRYEGLNMRYRLLGSPLCSI